MRLRDSGSGSLFGSVVQACSPVSPSGKLQTL